MTVRELLARIDSRELSEWMAYYNLDPWGPERADLRAGTIAATVANCHAAKGHTFRPSDFIPQYGKRVEVERTDEELRDLAIKANAMFGGTFVR